MAASRCGVILAALRCGVLFAAVAAQMEEDIAAPPAISITTTIDADDLFRVNVGAPGSCMCEKPSCEGERLLKDETVTYRAAERCNYYSVGGGISHLASGELCYTFKFDYKSCTVYPSDAFVSSFTNSEHAPECSRLNHASCTMQRSMEPAGQWMEYHTVVSIVADIDRTCNALPWTPCDDASACCGAGWACRYTDPDEFIRGGESPRMCQPPHGPDDWRDQSVFQSWGAKGVRYNN